MSLTCTKVSERLVDYLYEELSPEERQRFQLHLDGCEACRGEVAAIGRTLGRTRQALRGPLAEEAPLGVHAEIMKAARAASASLTGAGAPSLAGAAAGAASGRSPTRPRAEQAGGGGSGGGFWQWVRRPWFLPAFAAVSALALFFIARPALMKPAPSAVNDEGAPSVAEEPARESSERAPAPAPQASPSDRDERLAAGATAHPAAAAAPAASREGERSRAPARAKRAVAERTPASAPSRDDVAKPKAKGEGDPLGGLAGGFGVGGGLTGGGARAENAARPAERRALEPGGAPRAEPARRPEVVVADDPSGGESARGAGRWAAAPPPAAPAPVAAAAVTKTAQPEEEAAAAEGDGEESLARLSLPTLQKRALEAERARRRPEAARVLRELLRRFPDHRDAPGWRQRLQATLR